MKTVQGIVFSNRREEMLTELTANRCMGSVPVGGRYRLIDFSLSNMANSGIENVGIITKNNYQSLMDHVGSGREWDLSRKNGGLVILPPFGRSTEGNVYRGDVDALAGIQRYMRSNRSKYTLISNCDMMANIDYTELIQSHIHSRAEITVLYKHMPVSEEIDRTQTILRIGPDGFLQDMLLGPQITGKRNVYLNTMVLETGLCERMVEDCHIRNLFSLERDILLPAVGRHQVYAHPFEGHVSRFHSMRTYFEANMELLEAKTRQELFPKERPIYTKVRDEAPSLTGPSCRIQNSLIADGCVIRGEVENSILFRGVTVAKGSKVKNSVIMQGSSILPGVSLEYVVADKDVTITQNQYIISTRSYPVYVAKSSTV